MTPSPRSVLLLGATGTIGRATAKALTAAGHRVIAPVRPGADTSALPSSVPSALTQPVLATLMKEHACDAVISCLASRSGAPAEARAVDHHLNSAALRAAQGAGVAQFVLLSAICVQKPALAFQHAKLAFEAELQAAPIVWSIVRPTAYFKSLSGQLNRLRAGKPFLLFGNGALTACKPIGDDDLARYLVQCLADPDLQNRILPIGGPGPAITPRAQGEMLFQALGLTPRFKHVPVAMMSAIIAGLSVLGTFSPRLRDKAELARIGRYYATESMLVWNEATGRYDADATPEFGSETLADHYRRLATEDLPDDRGAHAVF
ncbi:NAD(P)H-binding protein [Tropicimonas sp. IMCC34043]|uniref:NAD(P)H-binding protein n=1 Tax=Tropicimonas sp. IMCC34043 TaxID=2248760 RepID=UPI000E26809F|nr:NAD(P)H-binding protein [Tropicimonas sp. IMCC34043]